MKIKTVNDILRVNGSWPVPILDILPTFRSKQKGPLRSWTSFGTEGLISVPISKKKKKKHSVNGRVTVSQGLPSTFP